MKRLGAFISSFCLLTTLLSAGAWAQGSAGIEFFAEPAPGSSVTDGYFVLEAEPGDSIDQTLSLRNDSKKPMTLRLYPTDARTSTYGGADYTAVTIEPKDVGTWISILDDEVTLKPGQGTKIDFMVRVPKDAPTGENLGGIAIYPVDESAAPVKTERADNQASAQIVVEYRRVIAVQVNTPGKAEPKLQISGIRPTARPDGAYLDMNIANEGTALTTGTGVIEVPGFDYKREFSLDTFVPNSAIYYPVRFDDSLPTGEHTATIRIEYDDGDKVVEWSNTFAVSEELQRELAERGAPGAAPLTTRGNLVPYVIALAAGSLILAFWRRRRRRAAAVPVTSGPAPLVVEREEPVPAVATEPEPALVAPSIAEVAPVDPEPIEAPLAENAPRPVASPDSLARYYVQPRAEPRKVVLRPKNPGPRSTGSSAQAANGSNGSAAPKKTPARRSTAKKTTVRKSAAKSSAKKTAAKKGTVKKSTARKPAAKTTAATKKTVAKKSAAKKTPAKKKSIKKTSAKKSTGRKTAVKKSSAKKTAARRKS